MRTSSQRLFRRCNVAMRNEPFVLLNLRPSPALDSGEARRVGSRLVAAFIEAVKRRPK